MPLGIDRVLRLRKPFPALGAVSKLRVRHRAAGFTLYSVCHYAVVHVSLIFNHIPGLSTTAFPGRGPVAVAVSVAAEFFFRFLEAVGMGR